MDHEPGNYYHNRWGYGCRHHYKKYDWKQNIFTAGRKLKEPCPKCEKPILKGQKYVKHHFLINFGLSSYLNYHLDCWTESNSLQKEDSN